MMQTTAPEPESSATHLTTFDEGKCYVVTAQALACQNAEPLTSHCLQGWCMSYNLEGE